MNEETKKIRDELNNLYLLKYIKDNEPPELLMAISTDMITMWTAGHATAMKDVGALIEALKFYSNTNNWSEGDTPGWHDTIDESDLVEHKYGSTGGGRAVEVLSRFTQTQTEKIEGE